MQGRNGTSPREESGDAYMDSAPDFQPAGLYTLDPTPGFAHPYPGEQQGPDAGDTQSGLAVTVEPEYAGFYATDPREGSALASEEERPVHDARDVQYGPTVTGELQQLAAIPSNVDPEILAIHQKQAEQVQRTQQIEQATQQAAAGLPSTFFDALHLEVYNEFYYPEDDVAHGDSAARQPPQPAARPAKKYARRSGRNLPKTQENKNKEKPEPKSKRKAQEDDEDGNENSRIKRKRMKPVDARRMRVAEGRAKYGANYIMPSWLDGLSEEEKLARSSVHGQIEGVPILSSWDTRGEVYECCVHRDTSRTVAGGASTGAYSIVLGGYNSEGVDNGNIFTMVGEGGRGGAEDPTAKREAFNIVSKDDLAQHQKWGRGNLALYKNVQQNTPVRVVRSHEGRGPYAPATGFRYDGLYRVTAYEMQTSQNGFVFLLFTFERLSNQPPIPRTD